MSIQASLLCPIDFSEGSLGALRSALAIARRFHSSITVLNVDDPLLVAVGDVRMGEGWSHGESERQLRALVAAAARGFVPVDVRYEVRAGKAAPVILEVARERGCHLIVMSTHGRSGAGKFFFGATAERVLRETSVPVLLAPRDPGPVTLDELVPKGAPMLVPVDFSAATPHQVQVAAWIADSQKLRMMISHVLEPVDLQAHPSIDESEVLSERHRLACRGLQTIAVGVPVTVAPQILISSGRPADEIARWARELPAGLLVMALHDGGPGRPRMGSVTYRAIAMSKVLTLALPPLCQD